MSVLSRDEYEFLEITLNGEAMPPSPTEVILPEMEDPYFEFTYPNGVSLFASGNVVVKAQLKEEPKVLEGGKSRRRATAVSIDRVKENQGDAV